MQKNQIYANGQKICELEGEVMTYFFISGVLKAQGKYINEHMEGKRIFNKKEGNLRQVGNFLHNLKHGEWLRYDDAGVVVYRGEYEHGKLVKTPH